MSLWWGVEITKRGMGLTCPPAGVLVHCNGYNAGSHGELPHYYVMADEPSRNPITIKGCESEELAAISGVCSPDHSSGRPQEAPHRRPTSSDG